MTFKTTYRIWLSLILGMVFIAQTFSVAHAARYTDDTHEHNGVVCEIALVSAEDINIVPLPQTVPSFIAAADIITHADFNSVTYIKPQSRAPPPRAPPF